MTDPQKARELAEKLRYIPRTTNNATQLTQRYRSHFLQQACRLPKLNHEPSSGPISRRACLTAP
jgi:hypothetical protein